MKAQVIQNGFGPKGTKTTNGNYYEYKAQLVERSNYPHEGTHLEPEAKVYLNDTLGWLDASIYDFDKKGDIRLTVSKRTSEIRIEVILSANDVPSEIVEFFKKERQQREEEKSRQKENRKSQMYNY